MIKHHIVSRNKTAINTSEETRVFLNWWISSIFVPYCEDRFLREENGFTVIVFRWEDVQLWDISVASMILERSPNTQLFYNFTKP